VQELLDEARDQDPEKPLGAHMQFDPRTVAVQQCPFPYYARLRQESPVYFEPHTGWWFVTRHEDVVSAFGRPDALSSRVGQYLRPAPSDPELAKEISAIRAAGWPEAPVLVVEDPPAHRRQRMLVLQAFTARRVAAMETGIRQTAGRLIDRLPSAEPFEFVAEFATPFPLLVIADALQMPRDRLPDFKRWSDNRVRIAGSSMTRDDRLEVARSEVERQHYFATALEERRRSPRGDLMSDLVHARLEGEGGRPLSTEELLSIIGQVLAAGNESTTKALTETLCRLAAHPDVWSWLREDPGSRAQQIADEGLRLACPFQILLRVTTRPVIVGETEIPPGNVLALVVGSASRDERKFDRPEVFDPTRTDTRNHLAFGSGIHRCIGANLARVELSAAVEGLATRFETLEADADNSFEYEPSFMVRGMRQLYLRGSSVRPSAPGKLAAP
jgi:cytochrome P450